MEYNQDLPRGKVPPVYCWGHKDIPRQWGIQTNALSSNQLRPLAGARHNAIFNTFRRVKGQFLYVVPPLAAALLLIEWAERRNKFLNSKEGRSMYMVGDDGI